MREIRQDLKVCSDCKNCKLIVWDSNADKVSKRNEVTRHRETEYYYTLRCTWLKSAIIEPHKIIKCEGKESYE